MPSSPNAGNFSALVASIRNSKGLSQKTVATAAGVSPGYIGGIETGARGKRPSRDIVAAIAQGLNATPDEREQLFRAAGYLGPGEPLHPAGRPSFEQFIGGDPVLRADQKAALIHTYRSMVRVRESRATR